MSTRIRLVTRGDDAGSCPSANRAIFEAVNARVLRNISIMVPGPAFEQAAEMFRGRPDICLGLHITLNAEWQKVKWKPVSSPENVRSLLDENGCFLETPMLFHERGLDEEQAMTEIRAQLQKARDAGLNIQYVDEHMGVSWVGGLRARIAEFCRAENLLDAHGVPALPIKPQQDCMTSWLESLSASPAGDYALITHPGCDEEDMRAFTLENLPTGQVARERDAERRAWCDPRLPQLLRENGVEAVRYSDVLS